MYEVYLDGKPLYYPGDQRCTLTATLLDRKLNEAGVFNITVPPTNPLFGSFKRRISEVVVYRNSKEIWSGEVRNDGLNLKKEKKVYVVGELAYLNASSQPQKKYEYKTPLEMLALLLNEHNSRVEKRKQFTVGMVTVGSEQYTWTTNYEKTLDYIRAEMCEKLGGCLRIRKKNGIRYLDLVRLQDYGKMCSQPIRFGRNLLDYTSNMDADSIVTVIRPLGAKKETSEIEGVDEYLTIESVNDGKDFIENIDAIDSGIGKVWETVHFNVLTDPAAVKTAGVNWLQSKQFENMIISVTAVDLSDMDVNIEEFELGDCVRTVAKPFGMDKWSYITEQKLDLLNPVRKHNISIGEHVRKTYTQQVISSQDEIKKQIPKETNLLTRAKENATAMLTAASQGYVYDIFDENGNRVEMLIMDTKDINTAKKVWRWNANGFGYSKNGYKGPYELAMTMDGRFVADAIIVEGLVVGKNVTMGEDAKISWGNVTEQPEIPSKTSDLTNDSGYETAESIKNTVITKDYIETLKVKAGSVEAENIDGKKISGKSIDATDIYFHNNTDNIESTFVVQPAYIDISVCDNNYSNPALYTSSVVVGANGMLYLIGRNIEIFEHNMTTWNGNVKFLDTVYNSGGGVAFTSDRNEKHSIEDLDIGKTEQFIYSLKPCKFKYNSGTSDRFHHGLIAQEVKECMGTDDWGLYVKQVDEDGAEHLALRYDELIADLIVTVQSQNKRIQQLEGRSDE